MLSLKPVSRAVGAICCHVSKSWVCGQWMGKWVAMGIAFGLISSCTSNESQFKTSSEVERAQTRIELGMSYLQLDQLQFAEEEFAKAIELNPRSDSAYHGLGLVAAKRQDQKTAKQHLSRAVKLNKDNALAVNDYAAVLCRTQEVDKGIAVLQSAGSDPERENNLARMTVWGVCKTAHHDISGAEKVYTRILVVVPEFEQALLSMAELRYQQRQYLSSRAFIERYIGAGHISPRALLLGAEIEQMLDNPSQKAAYLHRLWQQFPNSPQASTARDRYR